jgi:hypothetical protein
MMRGIGSCLPAGFGAKLVAIAVAGIVPDARSSQRESQWAWGAETWMDYLNRRMNSECRSAR